MAMLEYLPAKVSIVKITHNLANQTTLVALNWDDGSGRRLTLPVSFGTAMDAIAEAATEALAAFTGELGEAPIELALLSPPSSRGPGKRKKQPV